jgi:hypothetical protein
MSTGRDVKENFSRMLFYGGCRVRWDLGFIIQTSSLHSVFKTHSLKKKKNKNRKLVCNPFVGFILREETTTKAMRVNFHPFHRFHIF